jgi:hypothetical protein
MDITYQQGKNDLLVEGFGTSDRFKTRQRWGLQPVILCDSTGDLLEFYLEYIRPVVSLYNPPRNDDKLWLRYDGLREEHMGVRVTSFFQREMNLHITTTAIRSLVETTMDDLHEDGFISSSQKSSVHAINGHSSDVVADYYLRKARGRDVLRARSAFEFVDTQPNTSHGQASHQQQVNTQPPALAPALALPSTPAPPALALPSTPAPPALALPSTPAPPAHLPAFDDLVGMFLTATGPSGQSRWQPRPKAQALQFGTAHPDYNSLAKRARWTEEELDYIAKYCAEDRIRNPNNVNVMAGCLKQIMADPDALPIFHVIHILNTARLRNGYRSIQGK